MKSEPTSTSDLEKMIGKAAVEAAKMSSQASQAAKKFLGEVSEAKGYDIPAVDLIDGNEELIARVSLPGASKDAIDLRVTEDSLSVEAKAIPREGRYLRRETSTLGMKREIKLPLEIKPEQVKASYENGVLEVRLPKLVVVNAQRVTVD